MSAAQNRPPKPNKVVNDPPAAASAETALAGRAVAPGSLVACQPGSIVSRTIVDQDNGTVTLFAFGDGQALSEHTAPFDALVLVLEGTMTITISGAPRTVSAGEMIIMPAHAPHALKAEGDAKMMLVMIRS